MAEAGEGPGGLRIVEVEEAEADAVGRRVRSFDAEAGLAPKAITYKCPKCEQTVTVRADKKTSCGKYLLLCSLCDSLTIK